MLIASAKPMRLTATDFFPYYRPSQCDLRVWLRAQGEPEAEPGPYASVLMRLGAEHERRHLARFDSPLDLGEGTIEERAERTREAVAAGAAVIYQGVMRAETTIVGEEVEIVGVPDFMLRARAGYAIRDSKLSRRIDSHPEIQRQLAIYGWLYEQSFGRPPVAVQVHAGSGEVLDVPYLGADAALADLARIVEIRRLEAEPWTPVGWSKCSGCGYFDRCWPAAANRGDVGTVAGVTTALSSELHERGIATVDQLLAGVGEAELAEIETPWGRRTRKVGANAERILEAAGAAQAGREVVLRPPAVPEAENYVMFDLEGLPPQLDELEKIYLWGMQVFGERRHPFRAALAGFGRDGDREGWESFLAEAADIFAAHGDIPWVHWASYERAKLDMYVRRFGDRDGIAARVHANLVDLLEITWQSVILPLPGYGLKQLERYIGYARKLDDAGGDWAIAAYIEAMETEDSVARDPIMDRILTYNREDLEATWAVLQWLRGLG